MLKSRRRQGPGAARREGPIGVTIPGIMAPIRVDSLEKAAYEAWQVIRTLPVGYIQHEAYRALLCAPDVAERLTRQAYRGQVDTTFTVRGRTYRLVIDLQQQAAA